MADSHINMVLLFLLFATAHSGLAALRQRCELRIGARAFRVIFALVSIALALPVFIYYFNHRYDGVQLWHLQDRAWVHGLVAGLSALAFLFLYPATFNLGEIAAIQKPQVHLFETGIIRVSRHPQLIGMTLWCVAHTLWIGSSFALLTAVCLVGYHLFAVWHGDRRLYSRYGQAFVALKQRTSVIPFLAIWQGKQQFVFSEFLRPAYLGVIAVIIIFRYLHPIVLTASANLDF